MYIYISVICHTNAGKSFFQKVSYNSGNRSIDKPKNDTLAFGSYQFLMKLVWSSIKKRTLLFLLKICDKKNCVWSNMFKVIKYIHCHVLILLLANLSENFFLSSSGYLFWNSSRDLPIRQSRQTRCSIYLSIYIDLSI